MIRARALFVTLVLTLFAGSASAAEPPKIVHAPALAGGEVHVEGVLHVRFVGDQREDPSPDMLRTSWTTWARGGFARVTVLEARLPGQKAATWRAEHVSLCRQVAERFPAVPGPRPRG